MKEKIDVTYFFRKPFTGNHSIEELFGFITSSLPDTVSPRKVEMPHFSKGLLPRIRNAIFASGNQGEINHITGDVHYIAMLLKKRRSVLTIHDLVALRRNKGLKHKIIKLFWYTLPVRNVRYVTVISQNTRKELLEAVKMDPEKIVVIHDCISPAIKHVPKEFNKELPNILQMGTGHNKNLENIIRAIDGMKVKLTILGKLRDHQKTMLEKHKIHFENHSNVSYNKVIDLYRQADLVTFVSTYEGFGLPIIEANATGRPVIAGNNTSMPEVAGDAAILADPYNVEEIKGSIAKIIRDEEFRNNLIVKGLENIKRFSPVFIANQYAELYKKLISESHE